MNASSKETYLFSYYDDLTYAFKFLIERKLSEDLINISSDSLFRIRELGTGILRASKLEERVFLSIFKLDGETPKRTVLPRLAFRSWQPRVNRSVGTKLATSDVLNSKFEALICQKTKTSPVTVSNDVTRDSQCLN